MGRPHAVLIPSPAQGHVHALMELAHRLADRWFKITFINSEFNHKRMADSLSTNDEDDKELPMITFTSIPDGLEPEDDRNDLVKLSQSVFKHMPGKLEEMIQGINGNSIQEDMVSCVIADDSMCWAFEVAAKMGINHRVAFSPLPAAIWAQAYHIGKLIDDGIIDSEETTIVGQVNDLFAGAQVNDQESVLSPPGMPAMRQATKYIVLHIMRRNRDEKFANRVANKLICNSAFVLEPAAFTLFPKMLAIGPLLPRNRLGHSTGCFWTKDTACLKWLDQQPAKSVIYVAFGSFTLFQPNQFEELALGLELSGKRFLWVIRPDSSHPFPDGFQTRTSMRGLTVDWAPQPNVLSHPSVACFFTHCGWNSAMESVCNGVPFLCWPYHGDQFLIQDYICDFWKTGVQLDKDENGIITRKEIAKKVERLYVDDEIGMNAVKLMEMVGDSVRDGGQSSKNFEDFLQAIK